MQFSNAEHRLFRLALGRSPPVCRLAYHSHLIIITVYLPALSQASSLFIILGGIVFCAWYGGLGAGLLSVFLATIAADYYLIAPQFSLGIGSSEAILRLSLFTVMSVAIVLFVSCHQRTEAHLARSNDELKVLAARMEAVREEERIRLAHEIHDQLGGSLAVLKLDVASLYKHARQNAKLEAKAKDILKELDAAILTVQQVAMELRPPLLEHGLTEALHSYLDVNCRRAGLECEKDLDVSVQVQGDLAIALFRLFQEAFTNVVRHAKATKITTFLKQNSRTIMLAIADNGVGLEKGQMDSPHALGLLGMRERMRPFNGIVTISGDCGRGTTVTVMVPQGSLPDQASRRRTEAALQLLRREFPTTLLGKDPGT